ncbi:MAG: N-acetylmuramoyl-L-alanine amidase [Alphaproteobacteria bacterium]
MFLWSRKKVNYEDRPDGIVPSILLMHYTGMQTMDAAKERLSALDSTVSAHYLVDEDGTVFDLVSEDKRAWHAGVSFWAGEADINSHSIGVEIVNPGHEWGYRAFPKVQMEAVMHLSRDIIGRHQIRHVIGHSDVAPERKVDPGELFDWRYLHSHGVGLWPDPGQDDYMAAEAVSLNDFEVEKLFVELGYNPMAAYVDVVTAFHRHYYPERFSECAESEVCVETVARLLSLLRMSGADFPEKD